ncbi:MAG: dTMP kinase [Thermoplasmata archaeon]|nr:dTMP kinase [Thermoplasmata archaeon]
MSGYFITFEGIDGSGKTTIASRIVKKIENSVLTYEPTNSWIGESVKKAIEEGKDAITVALLFMADRNEHISKIKNWINEGKIVLCDRYLDSTYAYQKEALKGIVENPEKWIEEVQKPFILKPDLTLLFILPVEEALERIANRKKIIYEKKSFLEKVQENYMELAKKEKRIVIIDASRSIEEVEKDCIDAISKFLSLRRALE